jgi:two-component system, sensor histidine kinase and response regulator
MTSMGVRRSMNTSEHDRTIDRAEALSRVEGDSELMASLVDIFFAESGPMMAAIRSAVANNEPEKLEKTAHRLKGSVSIFCADAVAQVALELEKMGRNRNLACAAPAFARLEQLMSSLEPALKQFRSELLPSSN